MRSIAVVYHSTYNNTKAQAEAVLAGINMVPDVEVQLMDVESMAAQQWDFINEADAIIMGSPTYLGSVSSKFKAFMEKTGGIWAEQGWSNKMAAGFCSSDCASGDKLQVLTQISLFAAQHGMNWINLGLMPGDIERSGDETNLNRLGGWIGAMAQKDKINGGLYQCDLKTAQYLGSRVANTIKQHDFSAVLHSQSA